MAARSPDDEGMELHILQAVQAEAARALADIARDAIRRSPNGAEHRMSIDVRDDAGPVLQVRFEVDRYRH